MKAANIDELFKLEDYVEGAVQQYLKTIGIKAFKQRDPDDVGEAPYVNIQLQVGRATGHLRRDLKGAHWYDAWEATLGFEIVTKRSKDTNNEHSMLRAYIRRAMQKAAGSITESMLPHHTVTHIREAGTTPQIQDEDDLDVSQIRFDCVISIRNGAWP